MKRKNDVIISEPMTVVELLGYDYRWKANRFIERQYPTPELQEFYSRVEPEWNRMCNARAYAHIRICGRKAQIKYENRHFLLDDLFRLAGLTDNISYFRIKVPYNVNANFWTFYIGGLVAGEKERAIWVQSPNSIRARKYIFAGLSKTTGLKLKSVPRDKTAYDKYIKPFEDELRELTTKYYECFRLRFKEVDEYFNDVAGEFSVPAVNADVEWPYRMVLFLE